MLCIEYHHVDIFVADGIVVAATVVVDLYVVLVFALNVGTNKGPIGNLHPGKASLCAPLPHAEAVGLYKQT